MFPESERCPACFAQHQVRFSVALSVAVQLRHPVLRIPLRRRRMLRASVPEAAVNEDCNSLLREHDVSPASTTQGWEINSVSKAGRMQSPAHGKLG